MYNYVKRTPLIHGGNPYASRATVKEEPFVPLSQDFLNFNETVGVLLNRLMERQNTNTLAAQGFANFSEPSFDQEPNTQQELWQALQNLSVTPSPIDDSLTNTGDVFPTGAHGLPWCTPMPAPEDSEERLYFQRKADTLSLDEISELENLASSADHMLRNTPKLLEAELSSNQFPQSTSPTDEFNKQ